MEPAPRWFATLLGGFSLTRLDGRILQRFGTRRNDSLFAYLLLHLERRHSREVLADLFWPDASEPERARHSLSVAIATLRTHVQEDTPEPVLDADRTTLGVHPGMIVTDITRFEMALAQGDLPTAVSLYGGPLLPGFEDEWVMPERSRLRDRFLGATSVLIGQAEATGDGEEALRWERAGLRGDPTNPSFGEAVLRRLLDLGREEEAQQVYETMSPQLVAAGAALPDTFQQQFAPGKTRARFLKKSRETPPPIPLREMVGRQADVDRLATLFDGGTRLLLLTGGIGVGKTLVAHTLANRLYQKGWRVLLAVSGKGDTTVTPAITLLTALGHPSPEDQAEGDTLIEKELSHGATFLILDEAEDWVDGERAEWLIRILDRIPSLAILVISRRRGKTVQESAGAVMRLLPLPCPPIESIGALPDLPTNAPALALFTLHAQEAFPAFTPTDADTPDISRLVHQMDGVPLAIEMAAHRMSVLTPSELCHELTRNIGLLRMASADVPTRHRAIPDALQDAWLGLSAGAQRILLSIANSPEDALSPGDTEIALWEELQDAALVLPDDSGRLHCANRVRLFLASGYSFPSESSSPC